LEHLQERGELRNAGGRGGLGTRVVQAIADKFGYRMSAKMAGAIHDALSGEGLLDTAKEAVSPTAKNLSASKLIPQSIIDYMNKKKGVVP
jgi:hypothetical protein